MKMFMIEWFDGSRYVQEYYLQTETAFKRFKDLEMFVKDSNPDISTLHLNNE